MHPGAFSIRCPRCLFFFFSSPSSSSSSRGLPALPPCRFVIHINESNQASNQGKLFTLFFILCQCVCVCVCVCMCVCVGVAFSCPHHRDAHKWETGIGIPFKVLWVRESKPFVTERLLRCYRCDDCFFFFVFFSSEYRLELTAYWRDQPNWEKKKKVNSDERNCVSTQGILFACRTCDNRCYSSRLRVEM